MEDLVNLTCRVASSTAVPAPALYKELHRGLIQPPPTGEQPTLLGQGLSCLPPLATRWETVCLLLNATWET